MSRRDCGNSGFKLGVQRNIDVDGCAVLVLRLPETNATIADVLRSQAHCIFPATTCVDKEIESQAGLAAEWVSVAPRYHRWLKRLLRE